MNCAGNIRKLYIFQILRWFLLSMPVLVIFFQDNGLNMAQVLLLQSVFSMSMLILEVPSG